MAKLNRSCIICNTKYGYCNQCSEDLNKPSWFAIFHNENCHNIYQICVDVRDGKIGKEQAKKQLEKCDLSNLEAFEEGFRNRIQDVLKTEIETENVIDTTEDAAAENNMATNYAKKNKNRK